MHTPKVLDIVMVYQFIFLLFLLLVLLWGAENENMMVLMTVIAESLSANHMSIAGKISWPAITQEKHTTWHGEDMWHAFIKISKYLQPTAIWLKTEDVFSRVDKKSVDKRWEWEGKQEKEGGNH